MDLKNMIPGGAGEEQAPEQRLSKEEYAAMKKQQREEVWAEVDAQQRFPFYRPSASARTSSTATTGRPVSFRFTCTSVSRQMNSIGESKPS